MELRFLAYSVLLGLAHLVAASHFISFQYGYRWTAGERDTVMPPLKGAAGRVDLCTINFLETFPFFAAAVLAAHVTGRDGALTLWGVQLYFWGRIAYTAASLAGFPLVRSLIWNMALAGIYLIILALLV